MTAPFRLLASLIYCIPFITILSCGTIDKKAAQDVDLLEPQSPQTFLENHHQLQSTTAYRQNIWVLWNSGQRSEQVALCVDLQNQVYLVIRDASTVRPLAKLPEYYQNLSVSVPKLRSRMDPDAFILDHPVVGIFKVPANPPESFVADVIHQFLGKTVSPESLRYQAD